MRVPGTPLLAGLGSTFSGCRIPARWRGANALAFGAGLLLLLYASARQGFSALDPISLWLDDLWVATLVKCASLGELWELRAPAPCGFVALEKLIRALFGDGHVQLQAVPYLARLSSILGMALLATALTRHVGLGLVAAAGMALQDELAEQALRVKPYTLDACISVGLLLLALRFLRRPDSARLCLLGVATLLALPCSFPAVLVGPLLLSICALFHACDQRTREPARALRTLGIMLVFDALAAAWLAVLVHRSATPLLQGFWAAHYAPVRSFRAVARFFGTGPGHDFLTGAFEPVPWLALLAPIGLYALLRDHRTRALGVFVVALHGAALAGSALHLYPVGVPRLDSFLRPMQVLVAAMSLQPLAARGLLPPLVTASLAALATTWQLASRPVSYPAAGEKPLAAEVQGWLADEDTGLVLFPWANWAFAYYTDSPVRLVPVLDSTNGFFAIPERPRTWVLSETWQGRFFSDYARDASAFDAQLATLVSAPPRRLVFYGSCGAQRDYRAMVSQLERHGYVVAQADPRVLAIAVLLDHR